MTPADAAATLRRRDERERAAVEARAGALRSRLPAAAHLLRERHGATDIWLFGSLAGGRVHAASDVDLAVSVRIADYFVALAELAELLDADVDLVELPTAAPSLAARILAEGRPL